MRNLNKVFCVVFLIFLFTFSYVYAGDIELYFFHGEECPHCNAEKPWLENMSKEIGEELHIHAYETWHNTENAEIANVFREAYDVTSSGVPLTIIGERYWVGFSDEVAADMEKYIRESHETGTADPAEIVKDSKNFDITNGNNQTSIKVPLIGEVNLKDSSLLVSTIVIGLVDGVNPCSLWVLTMLLAMIIHTKSRKKALVVGFVYLTITAGIYALFIVGIFSLFNYVAYLKWIRTIVSIITLILGIINVKDFFYFKKGVSLTISDDKKPGIYKKMRNIIANKNNFWGMIGATAVLAVGVSMVEFSCTAAFPVIWGNLLASANVSKVEFAALLFVYMILYQLDEIVIYIVAVFTMKSNKMEEKHGRVLKLFSGLLMIILSVVMLVKPGLMNDVLSSVAVFGTAILLTVIVVAIVDRIGKGKEVTNETTKERN